MKNKTSADFAVGDHIRMGLGGVKHHAIVVDEPTDDDFVEIIEYGAFASPGGVKKSIFGSTFGSGQQQQGLVRRMRMDLTQLGADVEIINYDEKTRAARTDPNQVREAAYFLLEHTHLLPPYHLTFCNCECAARWCKTGEFASGQAKGFYKAGQRATQAVAHPTLMNITILRNMVASVGEATDSRRAHVENDWAQTQQLLDDAFEEYTTGLKTN